MTQQQLPRLGEPESQCLEFKAAKALENPAAIGREVVAFLNGDQEADIWIGIGEDKGGCAASIEAIETGRLADLESHLVDAVRPHIADGCVDVRRVEHASGVVAQVHIKPGPQPPYAQLHQGGWRFFRRTGARVTPLEFHQIDQLFRERFGRDKQAKAQEVDARETAANRLAALRDRDLAGGFGPHLWVGIVPVWQPEHAEPRAWMDDAVQRLLRDPQATGNRDVGWNFADPYHLPERHAAGARAPLREPLWTNGDGQRQRLALYADGGLAFRVELEHFDRSNPPRNLIWPLPFAEYVVSLFRLLRTGLQTKGLLGDTLPDAWLAEACFVGAVGWQLALRNPGRFGLDVDRRLKLEGDEAEHLTTGPRRMTAAQVQDSPDRCAFTLVRELYVQWGYLPGDVKLEVFDAASGVLLVG